MKNKPKDDDDLHHPIGSFNLPDGKDTLSQDDLKDGVNTAAETDQPHQALETPDGKNNGAEPAVFQNERKSRT